MSHKDFNSSPARLAILNDYPEEEWHSMDLCAQMLYTHLQAEQGDSFQTTQVCPPFQWRFKRLPTLGEKRAALNGDRLLNRFFDYPRYVRKRVTEFDLFHVADHTYAQLVHVLPPERTGVFCHDIDAFRSLIEPAQEPRPGWYQAMSRRILTGLQKAAVVFYSTSEIRKQIEHYGLLEPSRLVHAPYGIDSEFTITPDSINSAEEQVLEQVGKGPFLLHVGSCIPRKRIDVLLNVFAALQAKRPELRLVKVSGDFSVPQQEQIQQLKIGDSIIHLKGLERSAIASLYRKASLVLLTSEAEGFGLPVIEALACGAIVIASDIPVLQEVGGKAAVYCEVGNVLNWVNTVTELLNSPNLAPPLETRLEQASKYSWSTHAAIIAQAYLNLAQQKL